MTRRKDASSSRSNGGGSGGGGSAGRESTAKSAAAASSGSGGSGGKRTRDSMTTKANAAAAAAIDEREGESQSTTSCASPSDPSVSPPSRSHLRLLLAASARPFSIDLRALAAWRILAGLIVLHDVLVTRLSNGGWEMFGSSRGVWPVEDAVAALEAEGTPAFSLWFASSSDWWQLSCFALTALVATLYALGHSCFTTGPLLWALVVSLSHRVSAQASGGEDLLVAALMWAAFLPVGARWSAEDMMRRGGRKGEGEGRKRASSASVPSEPSSSSSAPSASLYPAESNAHYSLAGAAFVLQPCIMYLCSALLKTGKEWWPECTALWYALGGVDYVRPFGIWVRESFPLSALKALSFLALALEYAGPALIVSPVAFDLCRLVAVLSFALFHLGILVTLALGHFVPICLAVIVALLPPGVWDWFEHEVDEAREWVYGSSELKKEEAGEGTDGGGATVVRPRPVLVLSWSASASSDDLDDDSAARAEDAADFFRKLSAISEYFGPAHDGAGWEVELRDEAASDEAAIPSSSFPALRLKFLDSFGHSPLHEGSDALCALVAHSCFGRVLARWTGMDCRSGVGAALARLFVVAVDFVAASPYALWWIHALLPWTSPRVGGARRTSLLANVLAGLLLAYVLLQNASTLPVVREKFPSVGAVRNFFSRSDLPALLKLDQRWAMFAPAPYTQVSFVVMAGRMHKTDRGRGLNATASFSDDADGATPVGLVDVESFDPLSHARFDLPPMLSDKYASTNTHDYVDDLEGNEEAWSAWCVYHCEKWNKKFAHSKELQLVELEMWFLTHTTAAPGEPPIPLQKEHAMTQSCSSKYWP